jgi:hypothetical protein
MVYGIDMVGRLNYSEPTDVSQATVTPVRG